MLSNYISLVLAGAVVFLLIARVVAEKVGLQTNILLVGICFLFLLPLLLNNRGLIYSSRYFLSWIPSLFTIAITVLNIKSGIRIETSDFIGVRFFLLGLACTPFLSVQCEAPVRTNRCFDWIRITTLVV